MDILVAASVTSVLLSIIFLPISCFALRNYPIMTKPGVYSLGGFGIFLFISSVLLFPLFIEIGQPIFLYIIPILGILLSISELCRFFLLWGRMRKIDKQRKSHRY